MFSAGWTSSGSMTTAYPDVRIPISLATTYASCPSFSCCQATTRPPWRWTTKVTMVTSSTGEITRCSSNQTIPGLWEFFVILWYLKILDQENSKLQVFQYSKWLVDGINLLVEVCVLKKSYLFLFLSFWYITVCFVTSFCFA